MSQGTGQGADDRGDFKGVRIPEPDRLDRAAARHRLKDLAGRQARPH
jgi:hypothetical protein